MPQASAKQPPSGHPRICSQITGDSALQCWSGCEISPRVHHFYSRPCGRGDVAVTVAPADTVTFLLTPLREGRRLPCGQTRRPAYFYSRPCGRGDTPSLTSPSTVILFLLTPLREGRRKRPTQNPYPSRFLLTPLREGRHKTTFCLLVLSNFYSRPCGRGDAARSRWLSSTSKDFYSRPCGRGDPALRIPRDRLCISTHAPAGGATRSRPPAGRGGNYFYSRPCGRGDLIVTESNASKLIISTHAPAGGATRNGCAMLLVGAISTHAPAGGATWSGGSSFQKIRDFYSRPCGRGDNPFC